MQTEVKTFNSWQSLLEYYAENFKGERTSAEGGHNPLWVYRGQSSDKWDLKTSLERAVVKFDKKLDQALKIESGLLRKFQRHFQHYDTSLPEMSETVEWLAMMQHHFAPTRLLDWTYSFYIALFFALEETSGSSVVWAIDARWCTNTAMNMLTDHGKSIPSKHSQAHWPWKIKNLSENGQSISFGKDGPAFDGVFRSEKDWFPFVFPMTPLRLNQRLIFQQGTFLFPSDVKKTF